VNIATLLQRYNYLHISEHIFHNNSSFMTSQLCVPDNHLNHETFCFYAAEKKSLKLTFCLCLTKFALTSSSQAAGKALSGNRCTQTRWKSPNTLMPPDADAQGRRHSSSRSTSTTTHGAVVRIARGRGTDDDDDVVKFLVIFVRCIFRTWRTSVCGMTFSRFWRNVRGRATMWPASQPALSYDCCHLVDISRVGRVRSPSPAMNPLLRADAEEICNAPTKGRDRTIYKWPLSFSVQSFEGKAQKNDHNWNDN